MINKQQALQLDVFILKCSVCAVLPLTLEAAIGILCKGTIMPLHYSKEETRIQRFFEEPLLDNFLLRSQASIIWFFRKMLVHVKTMQCIYSAF